MNKLVIKILIILVIFFVTLCCVKEQNKPKEKNEEPKETFQSSEVLIFVSDPYPPYVIDGDKDKGYVTDATLLVFKKAGYEVKYKNVPYSRAINLIESGEYAGFLGVYPGRESYAYPDESLGYSKKSFFIRKGFNWKWEGVSSFDNMVFGVIKDYKLEETIIFPYIEKHKDDINRIQFTYGIDALSNNINKLIHGKIDLILGDEMVIWYTARELGIEDQIMVADVDDSFKESPIFESLRMSVGFHRSNPKAEEYAVLLSNGLDQIKKTGDFEKILAKYGLEGFAK